MHSNDETNEKQKIPRSKHMSTNLILSEGNKYLRLLQFQKAISCYEMILQRNANHIQSLLGKAKCFMNLGRYEEAWLDFDKILNVNPKCAEAINLKGIAEYLMGNFEKGFITYWQGFQIQPVCDYLRLGYQFCKKAIENSLSTNGHMLLTGKDIAKLNNLLLESDTYSSTGYDNKGLYSTDLKLLDDMCKDENSLALHSSCIDLFDYLKGRQKFRKMQEPHKVTDKSNAKKSVKSDMYESVQMNKLVRNFELCKAALNEGKITICINKGNEILDLLNNINEDFPEKTEIEAETLHYLVISYLIDEDFQIAMKYCNQLLTVVSQNDMPEVKGRALRDFGEIYYKSEKYKEALKFFLESLEFAEKEEEKAAILYKISDCNAHLNNLIDAKDTAGKCLDLVVRHQNLRFQFDVLLLLAEIAVKGREMKVAEKHYRNALEIAVRNNDTRKIDLEHLLEIFQEVAAKDSYSKERIKIIKISDNIKFT